MKNVSVRVGDVLALDAPPRGHVEIPKRAARLAEARAIFAARGRLTGGAVRVTLRPTFTDVHLLPSSLVVVTANEAEIQRLFCADWKEGSPLPSVPGIKFEVHRESIATGRR